MILSVADGENAMEEKGERTNSVMIDDNANPHGKNNATESDGGRPYRQAKRTKTRQINNARLEIHEENLNPPRV